MNSFVILFAFFMTYSYAQEVGEVRNEVHCSKVDSISAEENGYYALKFVKGSKNIRQIEGKLSAGELALALHAKANNADLCLSYDSENNNVTNRIVTIK